MSLFLAELRKVWGNRLFPLLLAVLAAANLLLLWMGTRPTAGQPSAAVYRAVGALYRAKITLSTPDVFAWTLVIVLLSAALSAAAAALLRTAKTRLCGEVRV